MSSSTSLTSSQTMIPGICSRTVSIPSGTSSPGRNLLVATTCLGLTGTLYRLYSDSTLYSMGISFNPIVLSKSPKHAVLNPTCLIRFDFAPSWTGETCVLFQNLLRSQNLKSPPPPPPITPLPSPRSLTQWTRDILSENATQKSLVPERSGTPPASCSDKLPLIVDRSGVEGREPSSPGGAVLGAGALNIKYLIMKTGFGEYILLVQ